MTSRTPMGVQPRPPQRSVSMSSLTAQRPATQRSLSQQYLPTSPARKEAYVDLTGDTTDVTQNRYGSTPRRGGSRLKLELSNEGPIGPSSATNSPQSLTPGRVPMASDAMDVSQMSPAVSRASHQDIDNLPMPMPKRRPQPSQRTLKAPRPVPSASAPSKKDARPKPYTVEVSADAPRYLATTKPQDSSGRGLADPFSKGLNSGYADFFPWTNCHHEDVWTSDAITKGTFDRTVFNAPETASAKMSIFPALKQKSGLNALSTIFMGVLNQRRHRGQITAPSTFKPPPRVTLTDTKREVWLRDLANPAISLRRLSRTIPHGIRGRTLLDQCLNKNVPTERAVWLAKCVGANEIRAFKRKGVNGAFVMGGESKWARDWTVFVEQFVDAVVSAFGEPEWKTKVTYAIRLATNLYAEHLLDRDHYLDWVVSGIEQCTQSKMPMWIIIAQIYWNDMMRSRKYGRRLVYALLGHLYTIHNDPDRDILIQLSNKLSGLLNTLVRTYPESFVYPPSWSKFRDALHASIPSNGEEMMKAYNDIHSRNSRLLVANISSPPLSRQHLVKLLDTTLQNPVDRELSTKCWMTSDHKPSVIQTVVEWATSFHRPGLAKIYVAVYLIREWSSFRISVTSAILESLDGIENHDMTRKGLMYHLVTELVRTGHFSVSQYTKWLMARGGYHDATEIDPEEGSCSGRLLVELPLHALSEKARTERANLLRRAGNYAADSEQHDIANALKCVNHTLGLPLPPDDPLLERKPMSVQKLLRKMKSSSKALRSSVGAHLRDVWLSYKNATATPPALFWSVRTVLENIEDFSMLSDVLLVCTKTADAEVLASCADTINSNLQVFLAIGSADDLFNNLIERLKAINAEHGLFPRPLLAALSSLAQRMAGREEIAGQLRHELLQSDRNNAFDACSPVSDNMAVQTQSPEGEVAEEIDKLLSSGTSLDNPTMNRLFRTIIPRLEMGWAKKDDTRRVFSSLLGRVRVFDPQHFDKLMTDWTSHIRAMPDRPRISDLFPLLITTGCLAMSIVISTASPPSSATTWQKDNQHGPATYLQELLEMIIMPLPAATGLTPDESYRYRIEQKCAKTDQSTGLLELIRNALHEYSKLSTQSSELELPLQDSAFQENLLETLRLLVLMDSSAVSKALNVKALPHEAVDLVRQVTTRLLIPGEYDDRQTSFDRILELTNELTLPFCQLKLNLDLSLPQMAASEAEDGASRFECFAKAMDRAIEARNIVWTSMLPCLSEDITQHLKSQAQHNFLDLVPSLKMTHPMDATLSRTIHMTENLLGVMEAVIAGQPPSKAAQFTTAMVEKLTDLWEIVSVEEHERGQLQDAVLKHWLPAMLRFVTLHSLSAEILTAPLVSASAAKVPNHDIRARILLVLCGILLELAALPPAMTGSLSQQVFDTAILLVDGLPEDLRAYCAKTILPTPGTTPSLASSSDPRLYYLFSAQQPATTDTLMLSHREKASAPQSAAARGMGAMYGIGPTLHERLSPFVLRRWEVLSEPTPNVGENDTSLSLGLFEAIKIQ